MKFKDHLRQDSHPESTSFDREREKCACEDCGKSFFRGDEWDNEKICLRCEAIYIVSLNDIEE